MQAAQSAWLKKAVEHRSPPPSLPDLAATEEARPMMRKRRLGDGNEGDEEAEEAAAVTP